LPPSEIDIHRYFFVFRTTQFAVNLQQGFDGIFAVVQFDFKESRFGFYAFNGGGLCSLLDFLDEVQVLLGL